MDETGCVDVANIACALIEDLAGGEVAPGCVDVYPAPRDHRPCRAQTRARARHLRRRYLPDFIERSLTRLGCKVSASGEGDGLVYTVTPPSFRPDLPREIDLIEEVLRLWGMGA